ncbi:glycosyltransferase family 39 protein [Enhygromyxa salina]|uniref:Glycosyltransferase RgtA/B/C/D-like domain-containing protein n=1 Tax=Enhygromyxa salina TaxID=215803 RepID=A0A2S9XCF7_9BACT|nr:glycosyltransferase family 39 protein [Enhygromyxa salina]PRP90361.1 hypothetical protein ENSA7_82460 [Enhygromyxa salina]
MNPELPRRPGPHDGLYDTAAVVVLLVMSIIALLTWQRFGITWDERYHVEYGDHILSFYESWGADKTALTFRIDYLYGGGFDLSGALFRKLAAPLDQYEAIHLFGTIVGVLGLWGTWRLGRVLGGPRAGLLAALFIGATSVYWGHMPNNPKDLPFAVGYVWSMALLLQAIGTYPRVPRALAIKLAIAIGLAMSVRIGGLLLVCYLVATIALWVGHHGWLRRDLEATYRYARRLALTGIGVVAGAWAVMLVWWPWALYDPVKRPLAAVRRMSQFMDHERDMPFAGEMVSNFDIDWRYLPHYFGYKMPEFVIVLFVLGTIVGVVTLIWRAREARWFTQNLVLGTLLVSLWFPWLYAVYKGSVLYDGLRHFLFLVPVMVAGVAWLVDVGIGALVKRFGRPAAVILAIVVATLCMDQYATMIRLHPHQYVYFNRFIGGVKGAVGKYDTDYYAETYEDTAEQFARHLWRTEPDVYLDTVYRIAGCGGPLRTMRRLPPNFQYHRKSYDFWMGYTRGNCHRRHRKSPAIFKLTRDGGLLNIVRDRREANRAKEAKDRAKAKANRAKAKADRAKTKSNRTRAKTEARPTPTQDSP